MREMLVVIHLTAAAAWVGGMICFVALLMPWVREQDAASRREQLRAFGHRFRRYAWMCLAVIGVTDPAWATQLRFLEATLLERLAGLDGAPVTTIEVRVRPI